MAQVFEPNRWPAAQAQPNNPHGLRMRKLLRSRTTKAFLTQDGGWTQDLRQAMQLTESSDTRIATRDLKPQDLEVYYSFDEDRPSRWDFTIALH